MLNVLGIEMRRINPNVLADHARMRLVGFGLLLDSRRGRHVVICDDMRPPDAPFMRELGFSFVEVVVDADGRLYVSTLGPARPMRVARFTPE